MRYDLLAQGGWAPDYWRRDERFKQLCVDMDAAGKLIGTICHGPWLLISAKILAGRRMTCFHAIKDDVRRRCCYAPATPLLTA